MTLYIGKIKSMNDIAILKGYINLMFLFINLNIMNATTNINSLNNNNKLIFDPKNIKDGKFENIFISDIMMPLLGRFYCELLCCNF